MRSRDRFLEQFLRMCCRVLSSSLEFSQVSRVSGVLGSLEVSRALSSFLEFFRVFSTSLEFSRAQVASEQACAIFSSAQVSPGQAWAVFSSTQVAPAQAYAVFSSAQVAREHACAPFYQVFVCFLEPGGPKLYECSKRLQSPYTCTETFLYLYIYT